MNTRTLILLIWCLTSYSFITAQISIERTPPSLSYNLEKNNIPKLEMPAINLARLQYEDAIYDEKVDYPWRFANPFNVDLNMLEEGKWSLLPNGERVCRLRISCPGALSINLLYSDFFMPEGGQFYIYNKDRSQIIGAFTDRNNKASRKFGTELIYDDEITLEYYEPHKVKGEGAITIAMVAHGYRTWSEFENSRGLGDSGNCQVNVNCEEGDDWQDEKKGVGKIVVNGSDWCSGSLVNNTSGDCTPYFLTADHCLGGLDAVSDPDASSWVIYWNYEYANCPNSGSVPSQTTAGATLLTNDSPSDYALLELTENPNGVYDVYFNGWNATNSIGAGGVGIHHPSGDAKKIATHTMTPLNDDWFGGTTDSHWEVNWDATANGYSVTEGGSSGSPLFNLEHRVVGQLHGGSSNNCSDPANDPGIYGKLSYSWENGGATDNRRRLKDWLDPVGGGTITTLDGAYDPCANTEVSFLRNASAINEASATDENGCYDYIDIPVVVKIGLAPSAPVDLNFVVSGTGTEGENGDFTITPSMLTLDENNLTQELIVRVFDDAYIEDVETIELSYTLDANGGDATAGMFNQTHTVTINDNDNSPSTGLSVTIYQADFDITGTDWVATDGGSTTDTWTIAPDRNGSSFDGSSFAIMDSDAPGNGSTTDEIYTSPPFNTNGIISLTLDFDHYFNAYGGTFNETADVEVFDGTEWHSVYHLEESDGDVGSWNAPDHQSIDIFEYANDAMQIRFRYVAAYDWWWALDNIVVTGGRAQSVQTDVNTDLAAEEYLGPNGTIHFYDPLSNNVMATIQNLSDHDFGCTTVAVDRQGSTPGTEPFMSSDPSFHLFSKTFKVTPTNNDVNANYAITLYYTNDEVEHWETTTGNPLEAAYIIKVAGDNQISDVNPSNHSDYSIDSGPVVIGNFDSNYTLTANFSGFSGFGVGIEQLIALPVEWMYFKGMHIPQKYNELKWATATEIDNDYFELERSVDGERFETIAKIESYGSSTTEQHYEYFDGDYQIGDNFYRLKQVDINGLYEYSDVIAIHVKNQSSGITAFPNPATKLVNLQLGENSLDGVNLSIFNISGQLVYEQKMTMTNNNTVELDIADFANGVYIIRVNHNSATHYTKLIKEE